MVDIPEHLLLRSAEARAKALGISVEQALAEMKGETEPTVVAKDPEIKVIDEDIKVRPKIEELIPHEISRFFFVKGDNIENKSCST